MKRRICLAWFGDLDGNHRGGRPKQQSQTVNEPVHGSEGAQQGPSKDKERSSELRRWIRKQ